MNIGAFENEFGEYVPAGQQAAGGLPAGLVISAEEIETRPGSNVTYDAKEQLGANRAQGAEYYPPIHRTRRILTQGLQPMNECWTGLTRVAIHNRNMNSRRDCMVYDWAASGHVMLG